jgi:two-component system, chemotaxis family, chemotaxis protein CheY
MKKILIVDDSEMVRNFYSYILKVFSFESDTAENGVVAYEKILNTEFSIILTDINMPKMNGYELIEKIRELEIKTPIIVISTQDEQKEILKGVSSGADVYLVKPTEPEKFIQTVKEILREERV